MTIPRRLGCLAVSGAALVLYLLTAYPEPGWVDSGELAAVAHTLGVAHPTGSPLYVLLARMFVVLLPGPFFPLTFLSALSVAIGLCLLTRVAQADWAGVIVAAVLAVAPSVWKQAIINEVYATQILLFALFFFVWYRTRQSYRLGILAYIAGLAFANHQSAIFLAPFLIDTILARRKQIKAWISTFACGLLGASLYVYLPIRSSAESLLDWGGTSRWDAFWRHITGWQYSGWVGAKDWAEFSAGLKQLGGWLWSNFPWLILPLAALGLAAMWRQSRRRFWTMLSAFLLCVAFGLNFPNPDVEAFYLLAFVIVAVWLGFGLTWLYARKRAYGIAATTLAVVSILPALPSQFAAQDHSKFRVATDWVRDALETVEPNAVILSREWDHVAPALYLQNVLGERQDVLWIDTELLRRSWYPEYIRRADPERYERAKAALDRLAPQIALFESGAAYDPNQIEGAYADAIYALSLGQPGPVYADWGMDRTYLRGAHQAPWGLLMRAFRADESVPELPAWPTYRNLKVSFADSPRTQYHLGLYGQARLARTTYTRAMSEP